WSSRPRQKRCCVTALLVILVATVVIALVLVLIYNGMVRSRNMVDQGWSGIDVQLRRRHDLIPNLVESVKGYAAHEREVLDAVTKARAQATQAQVQIPPDILNNPEAFRRFQEAQAQLTARCPGCSRYGDAIRSSRPTRISS